MAGSSKMGRKTYLQVVQSIQISKKLSEATKVDNLAISFTKKDARQLHHPLDDALLISLSIADFNTRGILVDNGSSANILYYSAFQQMRINKEHLTPLSTPLVGFCNTKVLPMGAITMLVTIGTYPQQCTKEVIFMVVDCPSLYNTVIDRPTLNAWKATLSTYYLLVKLPTKYEVGEARGD